MKLKSASRKSSPYSVWYAHVRLSLLGEVFMKRRVGGERFSLALCVPSLGDFGEFAGIH